MYVTSCMDMCMNECSHGQRSRWKRKKKEDNTKVLRKVMMIHDIWDNFSDLNLQTDSIVYVTNLFIYYFFLEKKEDTFYQGKWGIDWLSTQQGANKLLGDLVSPINILRDYISSMKLKIIIVLVRTFGMWQNCIFLGFFLEIYELLNVLLATKRRNFNGCVYN